MYKKQNIKKIVAEQSGNESLILNDMILGRDGAEVLAELIPQYHSNLVSIEIKGNNMDGQSFEMVCIALMNCSRLRAIHAEWNQIGSSPAGISALAYLVKNLKHLETIDLKNNRITHQLAQYIADIIKVNSSSLHAIDLRWNELSQIGAQIIYQSLPHNFFVKFIGLEDNRIPIHTLAQINEIVCNPSRGTAVFQTSTNQFNTGFKTQQTKIFPLSQNNYGSMDEQMKTGQLRTKIESEQRQDDIHKQKLQIQVEKALQKIRLKGTQMHESQLRYDILYAQNINLVNALRQSERILSMEKERFFGFDKSLNSDKSMLRAQKYNSNAKVQMMIEKNLQKQHREIEDLNLVMQQKMDRLQIFLRDKLLEKRQNREKVSELKEDVINYKISKQSAWDKTNLLSFGARNTHEDQIQVLDEAVAKLETSIKAEKKKGDYLSEELYGLVTKGLRGQQKQEKQIFEYQSKIKQLHRQMTLCNVDIESQQCNLSLQDSSILNKEADVDLQRRYVRYTQSQTSVNMQIEKLKSDEDVKADRINEQYVQTRIDELQHAVRQQQALNKMQRNDMEKLQVMLENNVKRHIHGVIFQ